MRSKAALERERASVLQQMAEAKLQAQMEATELAKARAALGQEMAENSARTQLVITAPQAGVVSGVSVQLGQTVAPGQLLATLLPPDTTADATAAAAPVIPATAGTQPEKSSVTTRDTQQLKTPQPVIASEAKQPSSNPAEGTSTAPLIAHFYATTRQAGFVQPGQRVRLRYAAYPYQKFGMGEGEVTEISRSPYAVQKLPTHLAAMLQTVAQSGDAVYRVTVRIHDSTVKAYGETHSLKPGMIAEADIVQDTRKLWEWALEPVFSVSGRCA